MPSSAHFRRKPRDPGSSEEAGVWDPEQPGDPGSGRNAAVAAAAAMTPAGSRQGSGMAAPASQGEGSGPAPVLMAPDYHLAVELLLLLFESILHLLPLQAAIPGERKAAHSSKAASCHPDVTASCTVLLQNQEKPAETKILHGSLTSTGSETGPGLPESTLPASKLTAARGQSSPLTCKVL